MSGALLAFDYGTRNIGVATGHSQTHQASEQPPLTARDGIPNWDSIQQLINEWQPALVLVGLPLNMDGTDSPLAVRARKFANRIHGRFGVQVEMVDERLSTFSAKQEADERGHKGNYGDQPVDSIAARLILETWLHQTRTEE